MKRLVIVLISFALVIAFTAPYKADAYDDYLKEYKPDSAVDELPEAARERLSDIGANGFDYRDFQSFGFAEILSLFLGSSEEAAAPLRLMSSVVAVMLLSSVLSGLRNSLESSMLQTVLNTVTTLCITCALVIPITSFISRCAELISAAANFTVAFVPIMGAVILLSGRVASSASYSAVTVFAGTLVSKLSAEFIAPLMRILLGVSVCSAVSQGINLSGIISLVSRVSKWLLGIMMALFTAVLALRQVISGGADTLSARAVKFSLSSFVPVVGAALSEAYSTVQSSVGLLKSGAGVFAVLAILATFAPILVQGMCWQFTVWVGRAVGEVLGQKEPCAVLEAVGSVLGILMGIVLCVMSIFIISSAVILLLGGSQ